MFLFERINPRHFSPQKIKKKQQQNRDQAQGLGDTTKQIILSRPVVCHIKFCTVFTLCSIFDIAVDLYLYLGMYMLMSMHRVLPGI